MPKEPTIAEKLESSFCKLASLQWAPQDDQGIALTREILAELDAEEDLDWALRTLLNTLETSPNTTYDGEIILDASFYEETGE